MGDEVQEAARRFCPSCRAEVKVIPTVTWQADFCGHCGHDLPDDKP